MELQNTTAKTNSFINEKFNHKLKEKISDKFDLSIIGKIDLADAEKIAQEEIIFLTETELIEGLENFELVPLKDLKTKKYRDQIFTNVNQQLVEEQKSIQDIQTDVTLISELEDYKSEQYFSDDIEDLIIEPAEAEPIQELPDENLHFDLDDIEQVEIDLKPIIEEEQLKDKYLTPIITDISDVNEPDDNIIISDINDVDQGTQSHETEVQIDDSQSVIGEFSIDNEFYTRDILDLKEKTFTELSKINLSSIRLLNKDQFIHSDLETDFIYDKIISDDFDKFIFEIDDYLKIKKEIYRSHIEHKLDGIDSEIGFIEQKLYQNNVSDLHRDDYFDTNINNELIIEEKTRDLEQSINSYNILETEIENSDKSDIELEKNEEYENITDKIIILEDKEMLEVFVNQYPDKHQNLIKLLSYLDGLFEKLPEEVIHKFVKSEYFGLYSALLQEIGD